MNSTTNFFYNSSDISSSLLFKNDLIILFKSNTRIELGNQKDAKISAYLAKNQNGEIIFIFHHAILLENSWFKGEEIININEYIDGYERYKGTQDDLAEESNINYTAIYDLLTNIDKELIFDQHLFPSISNL